jgi:hypothetical protein
MQFEKVQSTTHPLMIMLGSASQIARIKQYKGIPFPFQYKGPLYLLHHIIIALYHWFLWIILMGGSFFFLFLIIISVCISKMNEVT